MKIYIIMIIIFQFISSLIYGQERTLLFLSEWNQDDITLKCEISEKDSANFKIRELKIYKESVGNENVLYLYKTIDYPIAIFPVNDDAGNLITVWQGGSAYHIGVFSFYNGKITQVLATGSQYYPELYYENEDSKELAIIITNSGWVKDKKGTSNLAPISATRYVWNKMKYVQLPDVPWKTRFSTTKKISTK